MAVIVVGVNAVVLCLQLCVGISCFFSGFVYVLSGLVIVLLNLNGLPPKVIKHLNAQLIRV